MAFVASGHNDCHAFAVGVVEYLVEKSYVALGLCFRETASKAHVGDIRTIVRCVKDPGEDRRTTAISEGYAADFDAHQGGL